MPDPIERTDFPTARRGYERAAVDTHLARLWAEVERLRGEASATSSSAAATGEQVRSIVAAAEASAADIRGRAQAAAASTRAQARGDAERARDQVARARETASALLVAVEALDADLRGALETLGADEDHPTRPAAASSAPQPAGEAVAEPAAKESPPAAVPDAPPEPARPRSEPDAARRSTSAPPQDPESGPGGAGPAANGAHQDDLAGARLVALQAALSGRPRKEADAELAELLEPDARARLLDEVYAKAADA
ncbi:MAG: hypothetical protein U0T02_08840 [Solirubrobacteraceae bacterium]